MIFSNPGTDIVNSLENEVSASRDSASRDYDEEQPEAMETSDEQSDNLPTGNHLFAHCPPNVEHHWVIAKIWRNQSFQISQLHITSLNHKRQLPYSMHSSVMTWLNIWFGWVISMRSMTRVSTASWLMLQRCVCARWAPFVSLQHFFERPLSRFFCQATDLLTCIALFPHQIPRSKTWHAVWVIILALYRPIRII